MTLVKLTLLTVIAGTVSGCGDGLKRLAGPNDYIAVANDRGRDSGSNADDNAGIAVTPDGCQAWVIDDGVEGRASNRLDPVSGLPVCGGEPGVVYGSYLSGTQGIADRVPAPFDIEVQTVPVRTTTGHAHEVHGVNDAHDH